MNFDMVNGTFELFGAYFTWRNAYQLYKDGGEIKGVYWPMFSFMMMWGLWNLLYYPHLNQPLSFYAGILLTLGNVAWVTQAIAVTQFKGFYNGYRKK